MATRELCYSSLSIDGDPFRRGVDGCCAVHTCAGRYKQAIIGIREEGFDPRRLETMERCCRGILAEGYGLAAVCAQVYVLGLGR